VHPLEKSTAMFQSLPQSIMSFYPLEAASSIKNEYDLLPENWSEKKVRIPVRLATTEPRNETQEIQSGTNHRHPQGG
jgi:hypothetical protein